MPMKQTWNTIKAKVGNKKSADYSVSFFLFLLTFYKENVREMNRKQVMRINENKLRKIVSESVKRVLNEENEAEQLHSEIQQLIYNCLKKKIWKSC